MREISTIAAGLRAAKQAREHFLALWALEAAYDLPVAPGAAHADIRRLSESPSKTETSLYRQMFTDDK